MQVSLSKEGKTTPRSQAPAIRVASFCFKGCILPISLPPPCVLGPWCKHASCKPWNVRLINVTTVMCCILIHKKVPTVINQHSTPSSPISFYCCHCPSQQVMLVAREWKGDWPEELRSCGRLSASALCSAPIAAAVMEEKRFPQDLYAAKHTPQPWGINSEILALPMQPLPHHLQATGLLSLLPQEQGNSCPQQPSSNQQSGWQQLRMWPRVEAASGSGGLFLFQGQRKPRPCRGWEEAEGAQA